MRTVWKFPIPTDDHFVLNLPEGAQPLCVGVQRDMPMMWVLLDPSRPAATRHFRFAGTGHPIAGEAGRYIGTLQLFDDDLIFHVFEETRREI